MANLKDLVEDGLKYDGNEGTLYGSLTVLGWNGKVGNPKKYIVECLYANRRKYEYRRDLERHRRARGTLSS